MSPSLTTEQAASPAIALPHRPCDDPLVYGIQFLCSPCEDLARLQCLEVIGATAAPTEGHA
jgi:hypothetical protein